MAEASQLRGTILVEDRRTERFFRYLLEHFGCELRKVRFVVAPSGQGAAEAWVLKQYPVEVQYLRSKNFQQLFLIAVRDGDAAGVVERKAEMDEALKVAGKALREKSESIALPVPTWSIENWLLCLLKEPGIDEARVCGPQNLSWKLVFEQSYGLGKEADALRTAASRWASVSADLPSLSDGRRELERIW